MNTDRSQELNQKFRELIGSNNVYFQPPESFKMQYPCIRFKRSNPSSDQADNGIYRHRRGYDVIIIDPRPDSPWVDILLENFRYIQHLRSYTADNLNHDFFKIYY
jgi:hypothetical protein